jgi:hypothetical protein
VTLFITFAILFIGGPLVFRQLTRIAFGQRILGLMAVALMVAAIGMKYGAGDLWGEDMRVTMIVLLLIWMAWIVVLALGANALSRMSLDLHARRWVSVAGMAGTTVPWFGLVFARWLEG